MRKTPAGGATRSRAATLRVFGSKAAGAAGAAARGLGAACAAARGVEAEKLEPAAFGAPASGEL